MSGGEDCSICLDKCNANDPGLLLRCSHVFHAACLLTWADASSPDDVHPGCPNCRAQIVIVPGGPPSLDTLILYEYTNNRAQYLERQAGDEQEDPLEYEAMYDSDDIN